MAMQTAAMPCCSTSQVLQAEHQKQAIFSIGGAPVPQRGTVSRLESRGRARALSCGSPLQGVKLDGAIRASALGLWSRRRRGVARVEQFDVGTTTATSAPLTTELNVGGITEVDKDTFWPIVKSAGEKLVVLDMYTQWCGPCKLMLPKIEKLAEQLDDVIFLKLDCNQHNKVLAKELGIRVVPTFKIFKKNELVGSVNGAKFPDLVTAIENARKS